MSVNHHNGGQQLKLGGKDCKQCCKAVPQGTTAVSQTVHKHWEQAEICWIIPYRYWLLDYVFILGDNENSRYKSLMVS